MIVMLRSGWSYVHNTCKTWSLNPATIHISGRPFWIDSLQLTFQPVWRRNSWREQCWGGQAQPRNLIGKLGQGEPITWSRQTKDLVKVDQGPSSRTWSSASMASLTIVTGVSSPCRSWLPANTDWQPTQPFDHIVHLTIAWSKHLKSANSFKRISCLLTHKCWFSFI